MNKTIDTEWTGPWWRNSVTFVAEHVDYTQFNSVEGCCIQLNKKIVLLPKDKQEVLFMVYRLTKKTGWVNMLVQYL